MTKNVPHKLVLFGSALMKVDQPVGAVGLVPVSTEPRPKKHEDLNMENIHPLWLNIMHKF